jgi:hypothetical protein
VTWKASSVPIGFVRGVGELPVAECEAGFGKQSPWRIDLRTLQYAPEDLRAPLSASLLQRFLDKRPTVDFRRGLVARILDPTTNSEDRGYYDR